MKKLLAVLTATVVFAAITTGCGNRSTILPDSQTATGDEVEPAHTRADSVIVAIDQDSEPVVGFDPTMGWGGGEHTHDPLFQSTLLKINDDITIGYDLATEYSVSDDGREWTFKIRSDVLFTDGRPLTAEDVAFTFTTALNTVSDIDLTMLDRVDAVDATTAVFHLNKPYSPFAYLVSTIGIVPKHAYNAATYGQNPVGSGPFVFKQWDKGEQVIYEANPNYYGKPSNIQRVTVVFMTEESAYAAAQAGQVDVAYTSAAFTAKPVTGYETVSYKSVDGRALTMPVQPAGSTTRDVDSGEQIASGNAVTSSRAFRQAVSYAIDRETIASEVFHGYASPAYSNSPGMPWENEAAFIQYNPQKAKSILEADGWSLNGDGIYEKDGQLAEFTLTCMADSGRTGIAMAVTEMLAELGIKVINMGGMSWDEIAPTVYTTPNVMGTGQLSPAGEISRFYTGKNRIAYSNAAVDAHIDAALAAPSVEASYTHWKNSSWDGTDGSITDADCPWIFIVAVDHIYFVKQGLNATDNKIHPHGYGWVICNNIGEWSWN